MGAAFAGAPQTAFTIFAFFIFTALDCIDWVLGLFYNSLDAFLQADYQPSQPLEKPFHSGSDHLHGRARSHRHASHTGGVVRTHSGSPLTACVCQRLGDSGRARRLRTAKYGKWHKCECWGWQLGADRQRPSHQNGLHASSVNTPQPPVPAEVDPLASAPDAKHPSLLKAQENNPSLNEPGSFPRSHHPEDSPTPNSPPEPSDFTFPVPFSVNSPPPDSADSLWKGGPFRHQTRTHSKHHTSSHKHHRDQLQGSKPFAFPVGRRKEGRKKRVYVGRWTDCQCPHCIDLRTQRHRTLFVQRIGRGSKSQANRGEDSQLRKGEIRNGVVRTGEYTAGDDIDIEAGTNTAGLTSTGGNAGHVSNVSLPNGAFFDALSVFDQEASDSEVKAKPDLILLHGYSASSNFWLDTIVPHLPPTLLASRRIFAPDLLGTGKSPKPHDCHYTLKDHVEALESSVLAKHNVRSFHIVGHSMGTLMAVILAARNVSRVLSVTLLAPVYADMGPPGTPPCEALMDVWASGKVDTWQQLPGALWQRMFSTLPRWYLHFARFNSHLLYSRHSWLEALLPYVVPRAFPVNFVIDFLRDSWDVQLHMFNNTLMGGSHALDSAYQVLADGGVRILVDHGTSDLTCPIVGSEALARKYANVELRRCEGAKHLDIVLGREPEVVIEILEEIARGEQRRRRAQAV